MKITIILSFLADTIPYDFGGFISDIEEGPDGLVYRATRGLTSLIDKPK